MHRQLNAVSACRNPECFKLLRGCYRGIGQGSNAADTRHQLDQYVLPLTIQFGRKNTYSSGIASRTREGLNQACRNHVVGQPQNRNSLCRALRSADSIRSVTDDNLGTRLDQLCRNAHEIIATTGKTSEVDQQIAAFDKTEPV